MQAEWSGPDRQVLLDRVLFSPGSDPQLSAERPRTPLDTSI